MGLASPLEMTIPSGADLGAMRGGRVNIDLTVGGQYSAINFARGRFGNGIIFQILFNILRRAIHRIAKAAATGPAHCIHLAR